MSLLSGYSDNINYGNGYTPLATGAINNNNANYAANQDYTRLMAQAAMDQHNAAIQAQGPSSGYGMVGGYPSFGDPAPAGTYSPGGGLSSFSGTSLGGSQPAQTPNNIAEYYRLMGGGYGQPGGYTPQQPAYDDSAGLNPSTAPNGGAQPYGGELPWFWQGVRDWTGMGAAGPTPQPQPQQPTYSGWGIGSDAVGAPNQPGVGINWDQYFGNMTGNQQPAPGGQQNAGYDPYNPQSFGGQGGWGGAPANPDMQRLLGYDPNRPDPYQQWLQSGGYGGSKDQSQVPTGNRNPVQGGPDIGPFWQGVRDYFGADPKDQSRVPQTGIQAGGGLGQPGFGPYGGSGYTGQPGYGLAIGQIGAPGESLFGADPAWTGNQGTGGMLPGYGGLNDNRDAVTRELMRQQQMWQPSS
jgi:collagen type IV alpha